MGTRRGPEGPINLAVPEAPDDRELMRALCRVVGMPIGVPAARWMLEPAMWALRTELELVLKSRWVAPRRLLDRHGRSSSATLVPAADAMWRAPHEHGSEDRLTWVPVATEGDPAAIMTPGELDFAPDLLGFERPKVKVNAVRDARR